MAVTMQAQETSAICAQKSKVQKSSGTPAIAMDQLWASCSTRHPSCLTQLMNLRTRAGLYHHSSAETANGKASRPC